MNQLLPLSIALLLFSSCVEERSRRKARVFMFVAVMAVCIAFASACDKEQPQKEEKFDIELLGKESKMMADINGRSFTREFIFFRALSYLLIITGKSFFLLVNYLKTTTNTLILLSSCLKIAQSWLERNTFLTARRIIVKSRFYLKRLLIQAGI